MPSFLFDISASVWNSTYPIINTGGSFTGLSNSFVTNGSIVTVTCSWTSYSKISAADGLSFNTSYVTYGNSPSINIKQFGGVPLPNMISTATSPFFNFTGRITATDAPIIPNNTLASCFHGSTSTEYGNLNAWNVSNVTSMHQVFYYATKFNQSL
jgi:hypothetical protein